MIPESMIHVNGTEGNYIASTIGANISASGEAIFNLQDIASGTYHILKTNNSLGPDMVRQKEFLDLCFVRED